MSDKAPIPVRTPVTVIKVASSPTKFPKIARLWRKLHSGAFDHYRPERHYMRGPGPKWRERHGRLEASGNWEMGVAELDASLSHIANPFLGQ